MLDRIHEVREHIHAHPETSNREEETSRYLSGILEEAGLEITRGIAKTGFSALLRGGRPGPVVGARADMDALPLPMAESTGLPFASKVT